MTTEDQQLRERELDIGEKLDDLDPSPDFLVLRKDYAVVADDLYIVMPLADTSLAAHLQSVGSLTEAAAIPILRDIASGLAELATAAVLHRDLKPGNVLWLDGRWRLSDFGMARDLLQSTATYTFAGLGTVPYMAPEVWQNFRLTAKADLYALGVTAVQMLSGAMPFPGPSTGDFRHQHLNDQPFLPTSVSSRIELLLTQLLSKEPASRPQDARRVIATLDQANMDITSAQRGLVQARTIAATRRNQQQIEFSTQELAKEAIKDRRIQALVELDALLTDALIAAQAVLDDVELNRSRNYPILMAGNISLLVEPAEYPKNEEDLHERLPFVHAASVQILRIDEDGRRSFRTGPVLANLVCLQVEERVVWSWWRVLREVNLDDGTVPTTRWVGLPSDEALIDKIAKLWGHPETESAELTTTHILDALAEGISEHG